MTYLSLYNMVIYIITAVDYYIKIMMLINVRNSIFYLRKKNLSFYKWVELVLGNFFNKFLSCTSFIILNDQKWHGDWLLLLKNSLGWNRFGFWLITLNVVKKI